MALRLGDRLRLARHNQFVGREQERRLFESALIAPELPFNVLLIHGPGGVGKTSLLYEFAHLCSQHQLPAAYIDSRNIEPIPESFERIIQQHVGFNLTALPDEISASVPRLAVLLIDTYETLAPLDIWLRQTFLPQLPANVLTVLAGRQQPMMSWLSDPGWQSLVRTMPLSNLTQAESRTYLARCDIPIDQHAAILDFTHGHPLALSLVIDIFDQRPDTPPVFQPETAQNIVNLLLKRLIQKAAGPAHRAALESCALVRVMTESLLAEMLGAPDAHDLFDWLRSLSFIEAGRSGLFPHDLARDALTADLRWRNLDWFIELHRRARMFYTNHLQQVSGAAQQQIILDYVFLHRDNPMVRPFFEWQAGGGALPDAMQPDDAPALRAMVARYEGEASAELAGHWFTRQPENVVVLRDVEARPLGFMIMLALHQTGPDDARLDPAIAAAQHYLQKQTSLRPGERATLFRFWLAHDTYQAVSPIQSLIFVNIVRHYLTTPGLAFTLFPCAEPDFWASVFAYADLTRLPEADFEVDGHHYGVYGHDWRVTPPLIWLSLLAEREVALVTQTVSPVDQVPGITQTEFKQAVRDALHDLRNGQRSRLRTNPLLQSRLVGQTTASESQRVETLNRRLQEALDLLKQAPRDQKFYRALLHTYFQPAATQEQAAELLDLPFSTYRRHLKKGITRLTEYLWQQELGK